VSAVSRFGQKPQASVAAPAQTRASAKGRAFPVVRKQMPIPVHISIPAIGVDARIVPLGLNPDHTIHVPANIADAGWFRPGPEPGEVGAAVVVGHLASLRGPGVFWRLRYLRRGRVIRIRLVDGSTVRFVARSMMEVPKTRFPTKLVYARTKKPTLRLVTCAGLINPVTGHHRDNYIVFASFRGIIPGGPPA
jgi:sortase (surface protein transpeptidase)